MQQPIPAPPQAQGIRYLHHVMIDYTVLATKNGYIQQVTPYAVTNINQNIDSLNTWIKAYNDEADPVQKAHYLNGIKQQSKLIQEYYRGDIINALPDLQDQLHKVLFEDLQAQTELLAAGIPSAPPLVPTILSFDDLMTAMSPDKFSKFLEILSHGANIDYLALGMLYPAGDTSLEAIRFDEFLSNYDLVFLGGGNAQNFKLTNKATLEETVVKVEYRMGTPKYIEQNLRQTVLNDRLAPVFSDRQASFNHAVHGPTTCSLIHTALVKGGNLEDAAARYPDTKQRFMVALDLYGQMCDVFLKMEASNTAFPDAKNTNWLVDEHNRLQMADTKAFIPIGPDGKFEKNSNLWLGFSCIQTPYVSPPELGSSLAQPIDANAMHVYMWGKNLYQFVTNTTYIDIYDTKKLDFSLPVFTTPEGIILKHLIQHATHDDPLQRIRHEDAKIQLAEIQSSMQLREQTNDILDKLIASNPSSKAEYDILRAQIHMAADLVSVQQVHGIVSNKFEEFLRQEAHAKLDKLVVIDPAFIGNYTLLREGLNQANNLDNVQKMHDLVKDRFEVFIQEQFAQCRSLSQDISTVLSVLDSTHPSVFKTQLDAIEHTLQKNQHNPELLGEVKARLMLQKELCEHLNRILASPDITQLSKAQQKAIHDLAVKGMKTILQTTDVQALNRAKADFEPNFMRHVDKVLKQMPMAEKSTAYKAQLQHQIEQLENPAQSKIPQGKVKLEDPITNPMHHGSDDQDDAIMNPMHRPK